MGINNWISVGKNRLPLLLNLKKHKLFPSSGGIYQKISRNNYCSDPKSSSTESSETMNLSAVVSRLNKFAATSLAESWDNVGLLVEPTPPFEVNNLLITNDLTEPVLKEAISKDINLIVSYHPPIFVPMKQLTQRTAKERIVIKCIEERIAVFSPHTSYDMLRGGVNDWLIQPFKTDGSVIEPLHPATAKCYPTPGRYAVDVSCSLDGADGLQQQLTAINGVSQMFRLSEGEMCKLTMNCTDKGLERAVQLVNTCGQETVQQSLQIITLDKPPIPGHGSGRQCKLKQPIKLRDAVAMVKVHLQLNHVRLAVAEGASLDDPVKSVAVCAGSGSSVLKGTKVDLYVTGEMSHHEVLDATSRRVSVILCDHSNTERGYLHTLKPIFNDLFDSKVNVHLSDVDKDPLDIV